MNYLKDEHLSEDALQRLIGKIIRIERNRQRIKLSELANQINKSRQYVSEIEKGVKNISFATIEEIFKILDIEFTFCDFSEIKNLYKDFIELFYYRDIEKAKSKLRIIASNTRWKFSYNYPAVIIADYILHIIEHNILIKDAEKIIEFAPNYMKCLYYFFKGSFDFENKIDKITYDDYQESLNNVGSIPEYKAIIYTGIALVFDRQNDLIKAIDYNQKAYYEFTSHGNFERAVTNQLHIAIEYSKLYYLDIAIEKYEDTLRSAKRFHISRITGLVYQNLSEMYLYSENYKSAIKIANEGLQKFPNLHIFKCIKAWSYYELELYDKSALCLNGVVEEKLSPFAIHLKYILQNKIEYGKNSKEHLNCLIDFYNYNLIQNMPFEQMYALKLLTNYFENIQDYEKAYEYLKKIVSIMRK